MGMEWRVFGGISYGNEGARIDEVPIALSQAEKFIIEEKGSKKGEIESKEHDFCSPLLLCL